MSELLSKNEPEEMFSIRQIQKRDGNLVSFDKSRISRAIFLAMIASGEGSHEEAGKITEMICHTLQKTCRNYFIPNVEYVQDRVEEALIYSQYAKAAKAYILFRKQRDEMRKVQHFIPEKVKKLAHESEKYFAHPWNTFVYLRTYARWIESEGRRETWIETVDRYIDFMRENLGTKLSDIEYQEVRETILKQEVMPSMRLLQFAGKAARATHVCAYNCSYIAPSCLRDFAEVMYVLMCGTGVGFSVESQNIQALPQIKIQTGNKLPIHVIADSKEGWCDALLLGLETWFSGKDIAFDYSKLRPAGARLKTIGGKSSGPEPLRMLLEFTRKKVIQRQGRRLTNLDAHDILCKIGEVVVSGGVRRSAMISLSDLHDVDMRNAKKGQFYLTEPQRSIANNSAVYEEKPSSEDFVEEWLALLKSGSGERGIFNRGGLIKTLPERRKKILRDKHMIVNERMVGILGTNPCGEIILQSKQFCNLSEVIARENDTETDLIRKVKVATLIGTYQATLTNFPYLSEAWKDNCEQERLLGVSITGQWDCPVVRQADVLRTLKETAIQVNQSYASRFGVNASSCITCVKPSGTVSQTVDCAAGMHPRYAPYYIRRIRITATDALFKMLRDQGIPYHPEVGQSKENATTYVLEFPVKAPKEAVFNHQVSAIDQLNHWKMVKENYTEHNPSVTIYVGETEWIPVANWLYEHWEIIGGLSFLPRNNHVYQLAPYEEITKDQYEELLGRYDGLDFSKLTVYERQDETELKKEMACVGGACELV